VNNLVDAVAAALSRPDASGPFNIGDACTPSVAELLEHLLRSLSMPLTVAWIPRKVAWRAAIVCERLAGSREPLLSRYAVNQMSLNFTLNLERARHELCWQPREMYRNAFTAMAEASP
jgi:nucleoside-diphosphate-sugar epimerase